MPKGRSRQKSEYGIQLAEKQKIRNEYGLREKQFRGYFSEGKEAESIFALLERRLDSVVFRAGLAQTRPQARQLVNHGHITVNARKVTIPSYRVRSGDVVEVRTGSATIGVFAEYETRMKKFEAPTWLLVDTSKKRIELKAAPDIKEETQPFNFQTVIEFYSR